MRLIALTTLAIGFSSGAFAKPTKINERWKGFSEPEIMGSGFIHDVKALPLEGTMLGNHTRAWSGDYWPSKKGGVNKRWNTEDQQGFKYESPAREAVLKMSQEELAKLAPTEKYDLFLGNYDYPLREEAKGTASKRAKDWAGICHGWAPASLRHSEPVPKTVVNPDGIKIPFGSGDIKGLLSYYYAFYYEAESTNQVGLKCYFGSWLGGVKNCDEDLNAGAFHIIISNKLGMKGEGFLMDVDRFNEVWNQPVVGYKTKIVDEYLPRSKGAADLTVREMRVETELFYTNESDPTWNVVYGTKDQLIAKKDLVYRLELDADGKIIGGSWESKERPDFLWDKPKTPNFEGMFSRLPELLVD